jgi:hypothetical protein
MMPCSKFLFLATIFPKNFGERGRGGGGGGGFEKNYPDIKNKGQKNFPAHKPLKLRVKKIFPYKFLFKHG